MLAYRVKLEPDDNDTLLVTCPDLSGVVTFGGTRATALRHAVGAIGEWLACSMDHGEPVPRPRLAKRLRRDEAMVRVPPTSAVAVDRYWTKRADRTREISASK